MGWQTKGSGCYYTRSVREGGRVRREYVGSGEDARLIARLDAMERDKREMQAADRRRERQAEDDAQKLLRWYCGAVERILHAELRAAGYHQYNRGVWRKRRQPPQNEQTEEGEAMDPGKPLRAAIDEMNQREEQKRQAGEVKVQEIVQAPKADLAARPVPATPAEREAVVSAAMNGDDSQEALALACIRTHPAEFVLGWGDPKNPCTSLVGLSQKTPRARVFRARVEAEYNEDLWDLAGEHPTPLETLLAERITVLRFELTHWARVYEANMEKGITLPQSEHQQKRMDRLNRQYLKAIESLAKVRRLQLPAVVVGQMNIGEKQINVNHASEK